jgi:hypothetical protein
MQDIPLNVTVSCVDGKSGKSSHIIINPLNQVITHIVVQSEDFLGSNKRLVSPDQIIATNHKSIQLSCTKEELAGMEKFTEANYPHSGASQSEFCGFLPEHTFDEFDAYVMWPYLYPDPMIYSFPIEDEPIPDGGVAVHWGAEVEAIDGHIGRLDEFVIEPTDRHITHIVLREGHFWNKKELTLPLSAIADIDEETVYLKLDKKTVKSLPAVSVKHFYSSTLSSLI